MKPQKFVNGLAVLGVFIVLIGVTSAANTALAIEAGEFGSTLKIESSTAI